MTIEEENKFLKQRITELQEDNNKYLDRARRAEAVASAYERYAARLRGIHVATADVATELTESLANLRLHY